MTANNLGVGGENTDMDAGGAVHTDEVIANSDLDDTAMLQCNKRSAIVTSLSFSSKIPESDSGAILDEERQLHPSVQGDPISSPFGKRSRSRSGSDRIDVRDSN
jgi:hypothetical protein